MYNLDEVKEYISILENSTLSVLEVRKEDGSKIHLEKATAAPQFINSAPVANNAVIPQNSPVAEAVDKSSDNSETINAPIVGVFYAAPSPGAKPYVSAGAQVKKGETVCIIEAMKCMNEIQAEENYEIIEVLAKDGELVEYGQPLFKVK